MAQLTPSPYADLTLTAGIALNENPTSVPDLLYEVSRRVASIATEHSIFRDWCIRADALYFTQTFTKGGADLWGDDPSATLTGRSHVSVNTPPAYVDVPAALQAVRPIENMRATDNTDEARDAAEALERIYTAWKFEDHFELKFHKATTVKALYGRTAAFVYYDREEKRPCADVIEQPRNLYLGYKSDTYEEVEWAAYVTRREPNSIIEDFGYDVIAKTTDANIVIPWVMPATGAIGELPYPALNFGPARIEVWDYWYRRPAPGQKPGKPAKMDTWNVTVAGNAVVSGPTKYPEYEGDIPYIPLNNTFVPGAPTGRAELWDMEPMIREKMERITGGAQMIAGGTAGDYWQIVGPDAPTRVPPSAKPRRGEVIGPGAGNRIEPITPFIAQFQLEQYLGRLDREMAIISGLNDLLLGLAPAQVLSSSKAINALISNYESRLSMRRTLLYIWRRETWEMVLKIYAYKNKDVKAVVKQGGGRLDIIDPSLSPRDEMETATRAANLVGAKLWSQIRGMDAVGVDDPEQEQDIIRGERTDATLFPADVQVMAQLMAALQSLGLQAPPGAEGQAQQQLANGQNDLRTALGAASPNGTNATQGPDVQGGMPPEGLSPGATPPVNQPFAQGPAAPPPVLQQKLAAGQTSGRLLTQTSLGRRNG